MVRAKSVELAELCSFGYRRQQESDRFTSFASQYEAEYQSNYAARMAFMMDLQILVVLKQGQVEVLRAHLHRWELFLSKRVIFFYSKLMTPVFTFHVTHSVSHYSLLNPFI